MIAIIDSNGPHNTILIANILQHELVISQDRKQIHHLDSNIEKVYMPKHAKCVYIIL